MRCFGEPRAILRKDSGWRGDFRLQNERSKNADDKSAYERPVLDRKGNCWDNTVAESSALPSIQEFKAAIEQDKASGLYGKTTRAVRMANLKKSIWRNTG